MSDKRARQAAIRELVARKAVSSQEELRRLLGRQGWVVTQSTLSRDLRELRLARIPDSAGGVRYAFPDGVADDTTPLLHQLLPQLLIGAEGAQLFVVARTVPSGAQPVAAALDGAGWPELLGTIAGDDTVLLICRSEAARRRVQRRLAPLLHPSA